MRRILAAAAAITAVQLAQAQSPEAHPPAHADACAACHGANGISVAAGTPHLAGQDRAYLTAQLRAYRAGSRANPLMNALAAQLTDEQIDALAAFHSELPGPPHGAARSELQSALVTEDFPFASDYEEQFLRYHTTNPGTQVRHYYANPIAVEAAADGRPLPAGSYLLVEIFSAAIGEDGEPLRNEDGRFIPGERVGFNAMAHEAGWGDAIPELLRNGDWLYANFSTDRTLNTAVNQAACLACHVPLTEESFTFTLTELAEAAAAR